MKFTTGFITGVLVGGYVASSMTEQQRNAVADRARTAASKVRSSSVASTVAENASDIASAAGDRVAGVVDAAGAAAADAVAPDNAATAAS